MKLEQHLLINRVKVEQQLFINGLKLEQQLLINRNEVSTTTTDQQGMKLEPIFDQPGKNLLINREWS